jgi:2-(1,2-epoxy-1,2-dihydrophenyl)acetyl-CoA isomerase
MDPSVLIDIEDGVGALTLNRPAVLNALDDEMAQALLSSVVTMSQDDAVRVVVIRGAGDGFMAGGDIRYFQDLLHANEDRTRLHGLVRATIERVQTVVAILREMPKPVLASVHGACAGFGLSLTMAADLALAADNAAFTLAYIHLGVSPDGGASFHLPRVVGQKRAAEIALLGDRFGAEDAARWGLVNRVTPLAELAGATDALARRLASGPAAALARTKRLLNESQGNSLAGQLAVETEAFANCAMTEDFSIGVEAFLNKRRPEFTR